MPLVDARRSQRLLLRASILAAQRLHGQLRDILLVYGKEKVYGSIPQGAPQTSRSEADFQPAGPTVKII